jgi:hypothetical protein
MAPRRGRSDLYGVVAKVCLGLREVSTTEIETAEVIHA